MKTSIARVALGLGLGYGASMLVILGFGENPIEVSGVLIQGSFGSPYAMGLTAFYFSVLLLCGLSVAFAYRSGFFNIGAEGQLTVGAMALACTVSALEGNPRWVLITGGTLAAMAAGFIWGALAGWLRSYRGCHEVIATIMLNFVAFSLANWLTVYAFSDSTSPAPETPEISREAWLSTFSWFAGAPLTSALFLALSAVAALWVLSQTTRLGYALRLLAHGERRVSVAGFRAAPLAVLVLGISGATAALVAVPEVLGHAHRFRLGFSPGYGFAGIAIALLVQGRILSLIPSALLFAILHKGAADLELETEHISREVSYLIQAFMVLGVVCAEVLGAWWQRRRPVEREA